MAVMVPVTVIIITTVTVVLTMILMMLMVVMAMALLMNACPLASFTATDQMLQKRCSDPDFSRVTPTMLLIKHLLYA